MAHLYIGQAHDISWAGHKIIPTEEDYIRMVDGSMYCRSVFVALTHWQKKQVVSLYFSYA
jgi:hypothetical protein